MRMTGWSDLQLEGVAVGIDRWIPLSGPAAGSIPVYSTKSTLIGGVMPRKVPQKLASARAYWRLAAKADRNGNTKQAEHYRSVANRRFALHQRDQGSHD